MTAARTAVGALAVALFAWWATADGGYPPGAWYPGALLLLAALAAVARPSQWSALAPPARWALAALAAFTLWSFCSISWADARGDAWDGANRTLLYLTVFALFALLPWTPVEAARWIAAFALATACVGSWALLQAAAGDAGVFVGGRLASPIGYENATAALFLTAFWAALLLAARPGTRGLARAPLLAAAGVLLELTILAQSRGSLVAGVATLALAGLVVPDRRALLLALVPVAVVTAASLPTLLSVYEQAAADGGSAPVAVGISAGLLLAAGLALGPAERRLAGRRVPRHPRALAAGAAVVAVAAIGLALAVGPLTAAGGAADSRFAAGAGSGRYDFWRVAALEFVHHPLTGVGADNFAHDYVRDRRTGEEPLYPHSLAWRALAQTGIVGAGLLALFLSAVAAGVRRLPAADGLRRWAAVAALVSAAAWIVHGSIDWLWEVPAVAAPAMACLGLAAALGPRAAGRRPPPRAAGAAAAALVCAAAVSYALPALSAREVERAARDFGADRAGALRGLERARRLNPLSDRADIVAGALARGTGDDRTARRAYLAALDRNEANWHAQVEVGLLDLREGRRGAAVARLAHAREANPGEDLIGDALAAARSGGPASPLLLQALSDVSVPGPIERRAADCLPVFGLQPSCARRWRG